MQPDTTKFTLFFFKLLVGLVFFQKFQYRARNFLFSTEFQQKSQILVHFKTIQDFSQVVVSSPVTNISQIFPSNSTRHM